MNGATTNVGRRKTHKTDSAVVPLRRKEEKVNHFGDYATLRRWLTGHKQIVVRRLLSHCSFSFVVCLCSVQWLLHARHIEERKHRPLAHFNQ